MFRSKQVKKNTRKYQPPKKRPPLSGRFFYLLFFLFAFPQASSAQLLDSIAASFKHKPRPVVKLDTRNSFVTNFPAQVRGIKAGVKYGKNVRLGVGYCWLDYKKPTLLSATDIDTNWSGVKLYQHYGVVFFEYVFYRKNHWTATIPVQLGVGVSGYKDNAKTTLPHHGRGGLVTYEPAMIADYTFLKYFSVGAGVGYRLMLIPNRKIGERFTAPAYFLRFNFDIGRLAEEIMNVK